MQNAERGPGVNRPPFRMVCVVAGDQGEAINPMAVATIQ